MWQCAGLGGLSFQVISGFIGINEVCFAVLLLGWVGWGVGGG